MTTTKTPHPAQYSPEVIEQLRRLLHIHYPLWWGRPKLWDPCAGPGVRLAEIAGDDYDYGGTELEECFIINERIQHGDATDAASYPDVPFCIVTSVAYPNGMSDHAVANDDSKRYTYRKAVEMIEGVDRELHPNNQGAYGYRGTKYYPVAEALTKNTKRGEYWRLADSMVANWKRADRIFLNVSDFVHHTNIVEPVVHDWEDLLQMHGRTIVHCEPVETRRMKNGANRNTRATTEMIIVTS